MKIKIVESDDWVTITIDDAVVFENHSFHARDIKNLLQKLGYTATYKYEDEEE